MKKYVTEFTGTFFIVLTFGMAMGSGSILAPIAVGAMVMVMVYMGEYLSGAHYNPAITLAVYIRGKISLKEGGIYWLVQIVAATAAGFIAGILVQDEAFTFDVSPLNSASVFQALLVELLFTLAWVLVHLHVTMAKKVRGNSFYGMATGFLVMAAIFAGGPVSGGAFNPALGIGPNLVVQNFSPIWIYIVAPLAGGALAGLIYRFQEN